jgi:two-component system CheB/CheR fusion protein
VTGCSTGEEAYSLAITVSEIMDSIKKYFTVQIFATDINSEAIDIARKGIYPENIGADISPERLEKFFTHAPDGFHVKKQIRDMIVFSIQSVVKDPPFSRLDLVSCRNLLIYMGSILQKKIIPLFHYTLNPGGVLLLGTSESIGEHTDLFEPINSKLKVFIRRKSFGGKGMDFPGKSYADEPSGIKADEEAPLPGKKDIQTVIERTILDVYAPAGILINDKYDILHFVGKTDQYLKPPTGKPSFNLLDMAREELKNKLTIALHKVVQSKTATVCKDMKINQNGSSCSVDITIQPITGNELPKGSMLIIFDDKTPVDTPGGKAGKTVKTRKKNATLQTLEQELQSTREYLQATIEEMETSNEELKSSNEELQSVNEEMQSTNEEMETSKEELQSTNEELATVNAELQSKVDGYTKARDDMNNLLTATEIATLFIDINLYIKNYTPAATTIISLIATDIGRPLNDLKTCFGDVNLGSLAETVLKDLNTIEIEIQSVDDTWYTLKAIPYRTGENIIDGVVITFININKIKQADKFKRLATVLQDSNDAITVLDLSGDILAWNKGARKMYGWTEFEALKMNIRDILPADKQNELKLIVEELKKDEFIPPFKSDRKTKTGKILSVWLTVTALTDETGRPVEIATTERDLAWLNQI